MFGWTVEDLCGKSRRRPLVTARQIGMYVMRELTDFSYPRIAEAFGGRDHTTVMYAVDKIKQQMTERHVDLRAGQRAHRPDPPRQQWITLWIPGDCAGPAGDERRPPPCAASFRRPSVDSGGERGKPHPRLTCGKCLFIHNPQALQQQRDIDLHLVEEHQGLESEAETQAVARRSTVKFRC